MSNHTVTFTNEQVITFLLLMLLAVLVLIVLVVAMKQVYDRKYPDPIRVCKAYKNLGCHAVDGMFCNPKTCKDKLAVDMWELGQQLDIPISDRLPKHLVEELEKSKTNGTKN